MRIQWHGEELYVEGDYTKGEKKVMYPNDKAYPGSPSEYDISEIKWQTKKDLIDVTSLLCSDQRIIDEINELCINEIEEK